jgi:excisionase family DNA binding protein
MKNLAIRYSRRLVSGLRLPAHEQEDIQQDIHLARCLSHHRLDTSRSSPSTFLRHVAENEMKTIIARRRASRRGYGRCIGLDEETCQRVEGGGKNPFRTERRTLMRLDVRLRVRLLPTDLRRTAVALENRSPTEAARRLRVGRDTVYRRIKEIRVRFARLGRDGYLE